MRFLKLALAGLCALGLTAGAAKAEPVKIRMSWVAPVANWASILLYKKDLMKHLGKSYTLETIHFRGTPPMITALANNEIEISNLAYSTLAIAIANAGMDDIRVIADEFQDGVPGYFTEQYYVRKDSGINKVEDLKGKVVGTNAAGSAVDIASRAMLRKHGLEAQARLHHRGRPVAGHAGHAAGEEGRPHPRRAALRAQSEAARRRQGAVHPGPGARQDRR